MNIGRLQIVTALKAFIFTVIIVVFPMTYVNGQTTVLLNGTTTATTVSDACAIKFYDSGGAAADYAASQTYTITFCAPAGQQLRMDFQSFTLGATTDALTLYDGPSTASPTIGTFLTTNSPGVRTSTGTCMTVRFVSDAATNAAGWLANVTCKRPTNCTTNMLVNGNFDVNTANWTAGNKRNCDYFTNYKHRYFARGYIHFAWLCGYK
jgi:hypothetical protein